jgi:hypothetical protein
MGGPQAPLFLSNNVCEKKYERIYNCVVSKLQKQPKVITGRIRLSKFDNANRKWKKNRCTCKPIKDIVVDLLNQQI